MATNDGNPQGVTWFETEHGPVQAMRNSIGVTWILIVAMIVGVLGGAVATTGGSEAGAEPAVVTFSGVKDRATRNSTQAASGTSPASGAQTLDEIRKDSGLDRLERNGFTGAGIDIALVDTGVSPVPGLDGHDKLVFGPDLSVESGTPQAHIDTFGHGTHMAGILAGNDGSADGFEGMAPDSRIVSVKVAGADGVTTVPQVVAAIDWVIEHRNADGLNIRVLNLSFGMDGVTSHRNDPLSAAVERAWNAGIVVVAAAGNRGNEHRNLDSPAISPKVIAVGATDTNNAKLSKLATWSSSGNGHRNPDVVAAGQSLVSLRAPGSAADRANPESVVGERFMKGSGTSQAAAVMSGGVAALLSAAPELSNDQVKFLVMETAKDKLRGTVLDGAGLVLFDRAARSVRLAGSAPTQDSSPAATGAPDGLSAPSVSGATWSGGTWSKATWSGATWSGATWSGATWSGATWSGGTWSGATWSGATWSGATWSGATWSGATWSGGTWSGDTWSGGTWSKATWSGDIG